MLELSKEVFAGIDRPLPGVGVGPHHDTEHLFASPQLHGLEYGGSGQVNVLIGVTHVRT